MTDRTFGIELELHLPQGKTRGDLAVAIRRKTRLGCKVETYNHEVRGHWKLTTDASLTSSRRDMHTSGELVSPILCGEAGIEEARRVTEAVKAFGCTVSVKTGYHVHVGVADLTLDELRKVAINFVASETAFDAIMPESRRGDLNSYVLSNRTGYGPLGVTYENGAVNAAMDALTRSATIEALCHQMNVAGRGYADKFRKLNFQPYDRQKTIEFRQHGGTVEPDKVVNWIRLVLAFVERSRKSQPRKRPSTKKHVASSELGMLLKFLRLDAETCKFFRARRDEFCTRKAQEAAKRAAKLAQRMERRRLALAGRANTRALAAAIEESAGAAWDYGMVRAPAE